MCYTINVRRALERHELILESNLLLYSSVLQMQNMLLEGTIC